MMSSDSSSQSLTQPVHLASCLSRCRILDRRKDKGKRREALRVPKTMGSLCRLRVIEGERGSHR